ncbi:hypothetical protein ACMU_17895 [Actibacterium mucosum KCTC 23349]|uniref:Flagellar motor switch protein FliG n=1 Tax=Actibacterium mucosum KCTC 23349 TaxID=1454373 RepID=A0A037ZDM1_9RHOB|nr:hypothetical protein ACMU_17895 [Actibacterium mucosum KCTC 23349]
MRLLLSEGVNLPIADLPADLQSALTSELGAMRYIDAPTLRVVVGEFLEAMEQVGLTFPGGIEAALTMLDGHISEDLASRLRQGHGDAPDLWEELANVPHDMMVDVLSGESPLVAAVLLSKLPTADAAKILGLLPGDVARSIAVSVSQTAHVDPDTVDGIGETILEQIRAKPAPAFSDGADTRFGAILNLSGASTRDKVLNGLQADDSDFADRVRKAIFTIDHVATQLRATDAPVLTRSIAPEVLTTAFAGAPDHPATEYILSNISRRIADQLREAIQDRGEVTAEELEAAQTDIVLALRQLDADGEISLSPRNAAG